jgi:two-component system sensor histidine kinase KdpD
MTGFISLVHADQSMTVIPMLYLLVVTAAAFLLGSLPAVFASVIAFLAFDWFFVEPRYQFTVQDPAEWLALTMFLITAILTGQLTALLRTRAEEAQRGRQETAALAEASWAIASQLDRDHAINKVVSQLAQVVNPDYVSVLLPDEENKHSTVTEYVDPANKDPVHLSPDCVNFVLTHADSIGWDRAKPGGVGLEKPGTVYLPILLDSAVLGVLFMRLKPGMTMSSSQKQVIMSIVNHAAVIIQRDKLMKAEAMAHALAQADKLKTALLSMVSHDFRSPLTSIKASVSSLLQGGTPLDQQTQQSLLQAVDEETDRLNKMVGNILALSRLEAGAWSPRKETVEMKELIGSALDSFSDDENKRIRVDVDGNVQEIIVDSVQMVQVVRNLIENALKYSPPETFVELKVSRTDGGVLIEVMDRGSGLPKGNEQQIFKPFYRAPGLVESSTPGVGIGLALCRGLVDVNGGVVTADNRQGGGAVFRVTLPQETEVEQKPNS